MGNETNLKMDGGWESNSDTRYQQYPVTKSLQNKYIFDLSLARYRGSKFQNLPFYQHILSDMSSVKFVDTQEVSGLDFSHVLHFVGVNSIEGVGG